jgi:uncharacterized protein YndB with AHSA1/START domain
MTHEVHNGCARGAIETAAPLDDAYAALVRSERLAAWLGAPSAPLSTGGATRIEFGDGDFFAVDRIALAPPDRVSYAWRFLGIGPESRITWTLTRRGTRTEIAVTDDQPERSDGEVAATRDGWRDFLGRLASHLETGDTTRYDWRRDIDGAIELVSDAEHAAARLFALDALSHWLPWQAWAWRAGAELVVADAGEPAVVELVELAAEARALRLAITARPWKAVTRCELAIEPRRAGSLLTVRHTGWDQIDDRPAIQRAQRERLCRLWIASLIRARALDGEP